MNRYYINMINKLQVSNNIELPDEIIKKIISYADDLNFYRCHTCVKKISCVENYIKCIYFKFCSMECLRCC